MNTTLSELPPSAPQNKIQKYNPELHTTDETGQIRFDFLFSDWIFVWFVLFIMLPKEKSKYVSSHPITRFLVQNTNPFAAFVFAIVENVLTLLVILYYNPQPSIIIKFITMMLFSKILPTLYLYYHYPTVWIPNIISLFVIFTIYNLYLYYHSTNVYKIYKRTITSIVEDKDFTPIYKAFNALVALFTGKPA